MAFMGLFSNWHAALPIHMGNTIPLIRLSQDRHASTIALKLYVSHPTGVLCSQLTLSFWRRFRNMLYRKFQNDHLLYKQWHFRFNVSKCAWSQSEGERSEHHRSSLEVCILYRPVVVIFYNVPQFFCLHPFQAWVISNATIVTSGNIYFQSLCENILNYIE